jgi:hypothetical protein
MKPPSPSLRRIVREDCKPGDWIEASFIPEWADAQGRRPFRPDTVSISPESGRLGGVIPEALRETWEFESQTDGAQHYWVRVS